MRHILFVFTLGFASLFLIQEARAYRCYKVLGEEGNGSPEFDRHQKDYEKMQREFFESRHYDSATPFDKIERNDYLKLFKSVLDDAKIEIAQIETRQNGNFQQTILALEHISNRVARLSEVIGLIKSADMEPHIEAAAKESSSAHTEFWNQVIQSEKLFAIVKRFNEDKTLGKEERRLVDRLYKAFVRNGALLDPANKKRVAEIDKRISDLGNEFESNVTKSSSSTFVFSKDKAELAGLDEGVVSAAAELAAKNGRPGEYAFAMKGATYQRIMMTAQNRGLRERAYRAWFSRARSGEYDNIPLVQEIVKLRAEKAQILGFSSYAEYVLSDRMAKNIQNAVGFLEELADAAMPLAKKQYQELVDLHKEVAGINEVKPWDSGYLMEILSERKFGFSEESLRPYFEEKRVMASAFEVAQKLFGVEFKLRADVPGYHPDVQVYEVFKGGKSIGLLKADLYERDSKKQGAWMGNYRASGLNEKGVYENAHVTIVGGFKRGENGAPTLLNLDEVTTIFHELGHALHSLLSVAKYKSNTMASATWDFIELPSQFMEDWVYHRDIFFKLAIHNETGKPASEELYQKLLEKQTFMGALFMMGQLRYGLLDLYMYKNPNVDLSNIEAFETSVIGKYRIGEYVPGSTILPTMQHIISGGYATGYYSYMWANRMVADAFHYFKQHGGFNPEIAKRFEETVMSQGDIVDADELYRMFRGRDPDSSALLEKYGITRKH